jgi:hypothetical protein
MEIAEQAQLDTSRREVRKYGAAIALGYSVLAIVFLIAIYLGSLSSGTAPEDFALMTAFP